MADSLVTPTRYRGAIQILIALTLANLLGYAARNALFSAYADLRLRFPVDDADLGLLTTAFMLGQAIITVPVGWAGDRFGRKPVIAAGL
nr:MFS transporter [Kofleriaceae bacterium]